MTLDLIPVDLSLGSSGSDGVSDCSVLCVSDAFMSLEGVVKAACEC